MNSSDPVFKCVVLSVFTIVNVTMQSNLEKWWFSPGHLIFFFLSVFIEGHPHREQRRVLGQSPES